MSVKQTHNIAEQGDIVAGNKIEHNISFSSSPTIGELSALYEKLKNNKDETATSFCDEIEHYLSVATDGDVRGLPEKLEASGRTDELIEATKLKESATKKLMRYQTSRVAQRIYTIVLDDLHTKFQLVVKPAIQAGANRQQVDSLQLVALKDTQGTLGENVLELSLRDLRALLYFLGGNCHIRWDKC